MSAPQEGDIRSFEIPHEENPIEFGAGAIRRVASSFAVNDLAGIFPEGQEWFGGNRNFVYKRLDKVGQNQYRAMAYLSDGGFQVGITTREVGNYSTTWRFDSSSFQQATDLEIVRHAPELIGLAVAEVGEQIGDYDTVEDVDRALDVLETKGKIAIDQVSEVSRIALKEMGEDVQIQTEEEVLPVATVPEEIGSMREAINLFKDRLNVVKGVQVAVKNGRAKEVEKLLGELAARIDAEGLLETNLDTKDNERWFNPSWMLDGKPVGNTLTDEVHVRHGEHDVRKVAISAATGEIREFPYGKLTPEPFCARHVLMEAVLIAEGLIGAGVASRFPNLVWTNKPEVAV